MKRARQILFAPLIAFIAIQFVRPARNQNGQAVQADISSVYDIPDSTYTLLKNACYDCHSNNTSYPWYSNIHPIGWILASDIKNGKAMLNLSDFGSYSSRRRISKLVDMQNRIKDGTMPLPVYQFMHPDARLTEQDKQLLIDWIEKSKETTTLKK